MDPRHRPLFVDNRLAADVCLYCGGEPETREHLPSKVLLDEPYPQTLPTVRACRPCNNSFSLDEQYLASFLECVIHGSTEPSHVQRAKVRHILAESPKLRSEIGNACREEDENLVWYPKTDRVGKVIAKLAQGHVAYELYRQLEVPNQIWFMPFQSLTETQREQFERPDDATQAGWPEIGTRSFYRACGERPDDLAVSGGWVFVQPGRYRYSVADDAGIRVKIVMSEYLACIADWL